MPDEINAESTVSTEPIVPPEAQSAPTEPPEVIQEQVPSQPTIDPVEEARRARQEVDALREEMRAMRGDLSGQLEERYERIKQSSRDAIEARIRNLEEKYQYKASAYDELVTKGELTAEVASRYKQAERDKVEAEKWSQPAQQPPTWQAADEEQEWLREHKAEMELEWVRECQRAMAEYEINDNDPEAREFGAMRFGPRRDRSHLREMNRTLNKLARAKAKRIATLPSPKIQERQEQRVNAEKKQVMQNRAVVVDTGAGVAPPKAPTLEEKEAELQQLLDNPEVRDFEKRKAWEKRVSELSADVEKGAS